MTIWFARVRRAEGAAERGRTRSRIAPASSVRDRERRVEAKEDGIFSTPKENAVQRVGSESLTQEGDQRDVSYMNSLQPEMNSSRGNLG